MTRPAADRVKATWTGTGTGTMTLGAAAPGEPVQGFPASLNGQIVRYLIKHETAMEAEAGYGTYTSGTSQLTRTYRTYPTLGGSAVSFSAGTKFVSVTPLHSDFVPNLATIDPTVNDNINTGYLQGQVWINTTALSVWVCADHGGGSPNTTTWLRIDNVAGGGGGTIATQAEAEAGTSNTVYMSPLRTEQHYAARQAIAATGFNPGSVQIDDDDQYAQYDQSGPVGFAKNAAGIFRRGKVVQLTFDSDGSAITWTADFESLDLGLSLPTSFPAGLHTLFFTWNSHRSTIQVSWSSLLAIGAVLQDYSEVTVSQSGVTGAVTLNYAAGQKQTVTIGAGNVTSVTISNWPPTGEFGALTVDWIQDGVGGRTVADPANSAWFGGAPSYNTLAGKRNRVTYTTENAGTNLYNHYAGAL